MDWVGTGKVSATQIAGVLGRVKEELAEMPSPSDVIKSDYFHSASVCRGRSEGGTEQLAGGPAAALGNEDDVDPSPGTVGVCASRNG